MFFISTKSKLIKAGALALFLGANLSCLAQIQQSARFETPLTEVENEYFKVISVRQQGLVMYRRLTGRKEDQIELIRVDTSLNEVWKGYIAIDPNVALIHSQVRQNILFILFKNRNYAVGDFQIVAVQIRNGNFGSYTVKNLIPFSPTEFVITNEAAMIGGYYNYRPLILHYSFSTQQSKILPGFFNEPGELTQIKAYDDGSVDVIVSAKNFEKRKSLWIRNYDARGSLIKTTILQPDEKKNLIFGRSIKTPGGEQIVSGVYGRQSEYSRGVFIAAVNATGEYKINYYNFADLEHFFNYMKAKREKRVKERIERRRVKGKKIRFNYRILVHELVPYGDQYVLLGEAFYPHYTYPNRNFYQSTMAPSFYMNPLVRGDLVFDGFQYTHAVVIGFDKAGNLLWDNSFEINDVKVMKLDQYVKIQAQDNRIVLLYLFENTIRSKIISNAQVLEGKTFDDMKMKFSDDFVKNRDTETSKLDYWYKDNFFAYGVQRVHNQREGTVGMYRKVFFINKISYK